jgi:hypothetical protein
MNKIIVPSTHQIIYPKNYFSKKCNKCKCAFESCQGRQGEPGINGINGTNGTNGVRGSLIFFEDTDPSPITGPIFSLTTPLPSQFLPGDVWINNLTGDVFQYQSNNTWQFEENIIGPQGIQGIPGPLTLPINNTIFVDQQFGNILTAAREDYEKPYPTISDALNVSLPGDTIYINPGLYQEDNLILRDNINFYFTLGADLNNISNVIFTDSSNKVNVSITGFSNFTSNNGILLVNNDSNIIIEAQNFTNTGSFMFSIMSPLKSMINIEGHSLITNQMISIQGNTDTVIEFLKINNSSDLINISSSSQGSLSVTSPMITSSGQIISNADNFILNMSSQMFSSNTNTQAIQINSQNSKSIFDFRYINCIGGLLFANGTGSVVTINSSIIVIVCDLVRVFDIEACSFYLTFDTCTLTFTNSDFALNCRDGSVVNIFGQMLNSSTVTSTSFVNIFGFTSSFDINVSRLTSDNTILICSDSPIITFVVNISANFSLPGNTSAYILTGFVILNIYTLAIVNVSPSISMTPIVDVFNGNVLFQVTQYFYNGDNTVGIRTNSNSGINFSGEAFSGAGLNNLMLDISGQMNFEFMNVSCNGGGNILDLKGFAQIDVGNMSAEASGSAIIVSGNGGINGTVGHIGVQGGYIIRSTSTGNIVMNFNEFNANGNNVSSAISFEGDGDAYIIGNIINISNYNIAFNVSGIGSNTAAVSLLLNDFFTFQNNKIIFVDSPNGNFKMDCKNFQSNNSSIAAIHASSGYIQLMGFYNNNSNNIPLFLFDGDVNAFLDLSSALSNGEVMRASTTNNVWYNAIQTASNDSTNNMFTIISNGSGVFNIGGFMNTPASNAIEIQGTAFPNKLRILSSIIVSNGFSILNSTPTINPGVIIQQSITNQVTSNITEIPFGSLIVDPSVS